MKSAEQSEDKPRKQRGCAVIVVLFIITSPIAYLLSYGPASAMYRHCPVAIQQLMDLLYVPLIRRLNESAFPWILKQEYLDYLEWWR
jgi:hypothetical protein